MKRLETSSERLKVTVEKVSQEYVALAIPMLFIINLGLARTVYIHRIGMIVYLVIPLPNTPYVHRVCMVLANPGYTP
jgi:hypothetical protein